MEAGDIIIDGGNSNYRDDVDRARTLQPKGIHYVDIGTSGGVWGLERGYCLMIGGDDEAVAHPRSAAQVDRARRGRHPSARPGGSGDPAPEEQGYLHCGPSGAGHFVKMVHNGIEYGMMAAYAEGLNILHNAERRRSEPAEHSAEIAPLGEPRVLPVRHRHRRRSPRCGGAAASSRPGCST